MSLLLDYDDDSPRNNNHLSDLKCATDVCTHCGISGIIGAVARHRKGHHDNKGGQIKRMLLKLHETDEENVFGGKEEALVRGVAPAGGCYDAPNTSGPTSGAVVYDPVADCCCFPSTLCKWLWLKYLAIYPKE